MVYHKLHKIKQDVRFQMDLKHEVKRQRSRHKRNFSKESSAGNNNFEGTKMALSDWSRKRLEANLIGRETRRECQYGFNS